MCTKYTPEKFAERAKEISYFIAEDTQTKRVVGVIGLKENHLRTFFVHPEVQGQGIGRKLYEHMEQVAGKQGVTELFLEGSPLGEPVYRKFGFRKIKTIQKEREGIPYTDAYMVKKL